MKITIVLPVYNESKTIDAMLSQLESLPGDWEILFADGGSSDADIHGSLRKYDIQTVPG